MKIEIAQTFEQRCAAWNLVYSQYLVKQYTTPHHSRMLFSIYDFIPGTITIIARSNDRIIATMSLIFLSGIGFPLSSDFEQDLNKSNIDGKVYCECGKLAAINDTSSMGILTILKVVAKGIILARALTADYMFCVVHPKHADIWKNVFGYIPSSGIRPVGHVDGSPGLMLSLDIKQKFSSPSSIPSKGRKLIQDSLQSCMLPDYPHRMSIEEATYLLELRPEILRNSDERALRLLYLYYPKLESQIFTPYKKAS